MNPEIEKAYKAGRRDLIKWLREHNQCNRLTDVYDYSGTLWLDDEDWQALEKELGGKE